MTLDEILNKMQELFGEAVADPEIFPAQCRYQFLLARFELEKQTFKE
jgi:hypothetical protein